MELKSSVLLRAIRREALSEDLLGAGLESGASRIILQRAGECLAQILLQQEQTAALLRAARPAQVGLLEMIARELESRGAAVPDAVKSAIGADAHASVEPGEFDLHLYDLITAGIACGIRALRMQATLAAEDSAYIGDICRATTEIERGLRQELNCRLEALKAEGDRDAIEDAALPPPTVDQLTDYLRRWLPQFPQIESTDIRRLVGDNSKDIFYFDIRGADGIDGSYVMRREPACNVTLASVAVEYDLMNYMKRAGLPVPRALLGESDKRYFGGGFVVTEKLQGAPRIAAGLGPNAAGIMQQIAGLSAQIHQVEIPHNLPQYAGASYAARERALATVQSSYDRCLRERSEDSAILEAAYHWLHANVGVLDDAAVIVHGDYNLRNILLDGDCVSAILDWELTHVGHPAEDLAYIRSDVEQVMPWADYLEAYHQHSGYKVSDAALYYFDVWVQFWRIAMGACVYSGYERKRHRNFVWASVVCVEYREHVDRMVQLLSDVPTLTPVCPEGGEKLRPAPGEAGHPF